MRDYYKARASFYEDVYAKPERAADLAFLHEWVPSGCKDRRVLEVACGTGYWTRRIAAEAVHVVAGDLVPETIDQAQRSAPANVEFRRLDALDLPDDLGRFDAAFAGLWVSHVRRSDMVPFFVGLHRFLESGAVVTLIDNSTAQLADFPISRTDAHGNTYQQRTLADGQSHEVLKNFPTSDDLQRAVGDLGEQFEFRQLEHYWICRYRLKGGSH